MTCPEIGGKLPDILQPGGGQSDVHESSWHLWSGCPTDVSCLVLFSQRIIPFLMIERLSGSLLKCFSSLAHEKFNLIFKTSNCFMNILSPQLAHGFVFPILKALL